MNDYNITTYSTITEWRIGYDCHYNDGFHKHLFLGPFCIYWFPDGKCKITHWTFPKLFKD